MKWYCPGCFAVIEFRAKKAVLMLSNGETRELKNIAKKSRPIRFYPGLFHYMIYCPECSCQIAETNDLPEFFTHKTKMRI